MAVFSRIKTWVSNEVLTASDLNAEFNNILTNMKPAGIEGFSTSVSDMQSSTDPGSVGSESQAGDLLGELKRLRYVIKRIVGAQWYTDPTRYLTAGNLGVQTADIAASAVTTAKIADSNVTTAKIADSNVTTAKIADLNVTTGKINDLAVTTGKLAASAVTEAKVSPGTLTSTSMTDLGIDIKSHNSYPRGSTTFSASSTSAGTYVTVATLNVVVPAGMGIARPILISVFGTSDAYIDSGTNLTYVRIRQTASASATLGEWRLGSTSSPGNWYWPLIFTVPHQTISSSATTHTFLFEIKSAGASWTAGTMTGLVLA